MVRERQLTEKNIRLERELNRLLSERQPSTTLDLETPTTGPRHDRAASEALNLGNLSLPETHQEPGNTSSEITTELAGESQHSVDNDLLHYIQLSP